ncbi:MAG: hypothetical protein K6G15_04300 [Desulfovibrio sp.]|nr:hypothetical protein [Desulfovibrio sp.]
MRFPSLSLLVFVLSVCLPSFVVEAWADMALPPGLIKPYKSDKLTITCHCSGKTLTIYLHTPGPCDYTFALYAEDGKVLEGPVSGSSEHFGSHTLSVKRELPALKKGEHITFRYTAKGQLYNYKKVPIGDDDGILAKLGRRMRELRDPSTFRYEIKDKKGKTFDFDVPVVVTAEERGLSAQCQAKSLR